ncbi:MAG: hypothetical protein VKK42_00690 [Lyngbya sp.]|nr:hypothetical protein [Lyngbya sp.]
MNQYKDLKIEKIKKLAYKVTIAKNEDEVNEAVETLVEENEQFQEIEERQKKEWRCLQVWGDLSADRMDDIYPTLPFCPEAAQERINDGGSVLFELDYEPCFGDTCEDTGETVNQWLINEAKFKGIL